MPSSIDSKPVDGQRAGLRPGLRWALGLSAVASVWAVLSPADKTVAASGAVASTSSAVQPGGTTRRPSPATTSANAALIIPPRLDAQSLDAADRDPFMVPPPPAPPAPPPPPPPAPTAPPLNYRFLGQFIDPQGQRKVYLARPDNKDVLVEVGTRLDEGYRVDAITDDEVRLVHDPLQQRAVIRIPSPSPSPSP